MPGKSIAISDTAIRSIKTEGVIQELKKTMKGSFSIIQYESKEAVESDYSFIVSNINNIIQEVENIKKIAQELAVATANGNWIFPEQKVAAVEKSTNNDDKKSIKICDSKPFKDSPI